MLRLKELFQSFEGKDLYVNIIDKAAALIQSLINNHPFIDGNKRVGYVILRWFLIENHLDFNIEQNLIYEFIIKIASGNTDYNFIRSWLEKNTTTI